jgi:hypothetical protein
MQLFIGHLPQEDETTMLSLNITHRMPNQQHIPEETELELLMEFVISVRNVHCCWKILSALLEDTFSSYSSMR